jgi:hypothetical protein
MNTTTQLENQSATETLNPAATVPPPESGAMVASAAPGQQPCSTSFQTNAFTPDTPQPWHNEVSGALLLNELAMHLKKHVVLPDHAAEALALFIVHTYAFELRDVTAYLGVESPEKRCGKTTLLTFLSKVVNRPVVAANISPSAFFRVIEKTAPTLIIDEADTSLNGNEELRGILNAGYTKDTAFVVRVSNVPNESPSFSLSSSSMFPTPTLQNSITPDHCFPAPKTTGLSQFSVWCPKVLAAIGHLPDTLADRCILIRMNRKRRDEACERLRNFDPRNLRSFCARFVLDNREAIAAAQPAIPAGLNDRAADVWEPLLALADLAGEQWPQRARDAALALSAQAQANNPIGALLLDLAVALVETKNDRIFTRDLIARLNAQGQRPWHALRNGKPIDEFWLAAQLRPYGVRSRTIRIGEFISRGYVRSDLDNVFQRYISKSDVDTLRLQLAHPEEPAAVAA